MSERGDRLILGTRKGVILLERGPGGWVRTRTTHLGVPIAYAAHDARTDTLWTLHDHGHWGQKLQRSVDWGETWEALDPPEYPEGEVYGQEMNDEQKPATLEYLWIVHPGGTDQAGRLYLGTCPGGLFVSDDGGETWELNAALWGAKHRLEKWFGGGRDTPGIHSVVIDPRDSAHLFVGISCAGVYESTDGGAKLTVRNEGMVANFLPPIPEGETVAPEDNVGHDPHYIEASPANPDVIWMQNHCGIFRSTDAARTWTPRSEADGFPHFGFAISAADDDPDTAWVVPGESDARRVAVDGALVVCRTTDGGESWRELRSGLPQEGCYDMAYRHALDSAGDRVAFGTTSGNAFLSEDRGETWTSLGANLPLIYSVRFA